MSQNDITLAKDVIIRVYTQVIWRPLTLLTVLAFSKQLKHNKLL